MRMRSTSPVIWLVLSLFPIISCGGQGSGSARDGGGGAGTAGRGGGGAGGTAGAAGSGGRGGTAGSAGTGGAAGSAGTGGAAGAGGRGGSGGSAGTGGTAGSAGTGGAGGSSASVGCPVNPSACTDGRDNDGDGKIDALDPECSGACDNDEGTFATGISGDNMDDLKSCKQDCFFDGNSGADEGCQFELTCDPARANATACKYEAPSGNRCAPQTDTCRRNCARLTPNGCDCFGCCTVPGVNFGVRLSSTCSVASINDPTKCERCTPQVSCQNTCEKCEVCFGKPSPDPSCVIPPPSDGGAGGTGGGTGGTGGSAGAGGSGGADAGAGGAGGGGESPCPPGVNYCGPGGVSACPGGAFCVTGCCIIP